MVCKTRFTSSQPQKIQQFVVRDLRWPSPPTTYRGFRPSVRNVSSVMGRGTGSGQVRRNWALTIRLWRNSIWKKHLINPAQSESEFLRISSYSKVRRIPKIPESSKKRKIPCRKSWYNSAPRFVLPLQSSWFQTLCLEHLLLSKFWGSLVPTLKRCETSCIHRRPCWKMFGKSHLAFHDFHDFRDFLILDWSRLPRFTVLHLLVQSLVCFLFVTPMHAQHCHNGWMHVQSKNN